MENLQVKNVIISRQKEESENFLKLVEIAKNNNVRLTIVKAGDKIALGKNLWIKILWPTEKQEISDNVLNNNSIVAKLITDNFSMLFTGDIETVAEKAILKKYNNNLNELKSTVLKIAHHGSKTSSTKEFLEAVNPKIVLIGVGKNNTFGHPSEVTLKNLTSIGCKIYRTDENGEITLSQLAGGEKGLKIQTFIK